MMRLVRTTLSIAAGVFVAACGGGGGSTDPGGNPPPPPPPGGGTQTLGSVITSVSSLTLTAGSSGTISVTARDTQGATMTAGVSVAYSSADPTIAEVSPAGSVFAIAAGSTQIAVSATAAGVTRTASVAVSVSGALPRIATVTANADAAYPSFDPGKVAIASGGAVTFQFGSLEHTVNFSGSGAPASIMPSYSTSVSRTFATRGNFTYTCSIHTGMTGEVIVR
jgi:plastocyanin